MPLFDLSQVTATLADMLRNNITRVLDPTLTQLDVTMLPPERVSGAEFTLNLYLYHLSQDPHYLNLPGNLSDRRPLATKPMSLILYYILTAHHELETQFDTITEQRLMGYALKTLHDFAVIDDNTHLNDGTPVMPDELRHRDNALEISLRPVTAEEAIAFWQAEDVHTTRLSAYYEVRYALLEPDPPRRLPGLVLSLGTFVVDATSPRIRTTQSQLAFDLPEAVGGGSHPVDVEPGRVGFPDGNVLTLLGDALGVGQSRRVILRNARWRALGPAFARVRIDPELPDNDDWAVAQVQGALQVTFGTALTVIVDGAPTALPLTPGLYMVSLEVVKDSEVQFGRLKEITDRSNEAPFLVIPRITGFTVEDVDVGGELQQRVHLSFDASLDLTPTPPLDILLVANGENYLPFDPTDPNDTFDVGDFQPATSALTFRPRFDATASGLYPIRVIVEGAESQPFWIEVP